jgi:N-acetylneuraminate synthase/N,N'-diacetyllegionaminate synthase
MPVTEPGAGAPSEAGVLFLVPARGGSVRIPGKNLREVAGIPLVGNAVRQARLAAVAVPGGRHAVVCSTDDPEIAACARDWGAEVPFERPASLATADTTSVDVAVHALDTLAAAGRTYRALVLIQPTSPLTAPADLVAAVARFDADPDHAPLASVTPTHPAAWHMAGSPGPLEPVADHADRPAAHLLTGAFYLMAPDELMRERRFVVPGRTAGVVVTPDRSVDVDEPIDLVVAEALARARPVRPVTLGKHEVGAGGCLVIAEAGVNHNGDLVLAHRLVDAAADAGADVVKFQTFAPERLASVGAPTAEYQRAAGIAADGQQEMLTRLALADDAWPELREHAEQRGLIFLSSPFDESSADLLERVGVPAFKVGSGELTNHPFLAHLSRIGRPLLVSTGMATMCEVAAALDVVAHNGGVPVALFHCVSSYPARPADANLRAIESMRAAFGVPVGWSCHTDGIELGIAAAARGADLVEKHLTLDRSMSGPDHGASLEPAAFAAMVHGIRDATSSLGSGRKIPVDAERDVAVVARRSLYWAADLRMGDVIGPDDLVALRPGTGIAPAERDSLVGRTVREAVRAGNAVQREDVAAAPDGTS